MPKRVSLGERLGKDAKAEANAGSLLESTKVAGRAKMMIYVRPEQVHAIEAIQFQEWQRTQKIPPKSALVQEAIDLLIDKYGVKQ